MTDTERFFLKDLPAAIVREIPRFRSLSGSLAFSCGGKKFTVILGDLDAPVVAGFLRNADVKLWFFGDAFDRFLEGTLHDVTKRDMRVEGDLDVFARFGKFLQPVETANALSVRFASPTSPAATH